MTLTFEQFYYSGYRDGFAGRQRQDMAAFFTAGTWLAYCNGYEDGLRWLVAEGREIRRSQAGFVS